MAIRNFFSKHVPGSAKSRIYAGKSTKRGFSLMSNDEKKFHPIFQILHIKSAWFLSKLAMALVTTIGTRFLQVCIDYSLIPKTSVKITVLKLIFVEIGQVNFSNMGYCICKSCEKDGLLLATYSFTNYNPGQVGS